MAEQGVGSPVSIRHYGKGGFFNGCERRKVSSIWELPEEVTERFIDVLGARDDEGEVDSTKFHERITPIGTEVAALLRERLEVEIPEPLCRKANYKNCGVSVNDFSQITFKPLEGPLQPHIPAHVECSTALIDAVDSNAGIAAPVAVENAPDYMRFEAGCHAQIGAVAELAGSLMYERLLELEAAQQAGA